MANIKNCKVGEFVQVMSKGMANRRARVVSKTAKRVYCFIMEGGKYIREDNGMEKRFLVDPKNIKFCATKEEDSAE